MKFRTEYKASHKEELNPERLVFLGSCFSENIGRKLRECNCEVTINPCGVVYNPASIDKLLALVEESPENLKEGIIDWVDRLKIVGRDGKRVSLYFSSAVVGDDDLLLAKRSIERLDKLKKSLQTSTGVIVTLGTSYVYLHRNEVVSNCHKLSDKEFERRRLSLDECRDLLISIVGRIRRISGRSDLRVIFTVSPVRHLRDGFEENARSKATLLLACEEFEYFPAYEILTDDLRDYRFYAEDLIHPSVQGIEYIWENFCSTYVSSENLAKLKDGAAAWRRSQHRPLC